MIPVCIGCYYSPLHPSWTITSARLKQEEEERSRIVAEGTESSSFLRQQLEDDEDRICIEDDVAE